MLREGKTYLAHDCVVQFGVKDDELMNSYTTEEGLTAS